MTKTTLNILGRSYVSVGDNLSDAIRKLKVPTVKSKGILTVEEGETKKERILSHVVLKRLFVLSPTMREVAIKQLTQLF